jgi:hypothetical protein
MIHLTQKKTYLLKAQIMFSECPKDVALVWGTPSVRFYVEPSTLTTTSGHKFPSACTVEVEYPVSIASINKELWSTEFLNSHAYDLVNYLSRDIQEFSLHNWRVRLFVTTHTAVDQIGWSAKGTYTVPHYNRVTVEHDIRDQVSDFARRHEGWDNA